MESRMTKISARGDKKIQLKVIPGHFATPQSHITPLSGPYHYAFQKFRGTSCRRGTGCQL